MKKIKLVLPVIVAGSATLPLTMITSCTQNDLVVQGGSTELTTYYSEFGCDTIAWRTTLQGKEIYPTYSIVNLSNEKADLHVDNGTVYWSNPTCAYETITFNVKATYNGHVGFSPQISVTTSPTKDSYFEWTANNDGYTITKYNGDAKSVYIPRQHLGKPVNSISYQAFWNLDYLEDVQIPKSIKILGNDVFRSCNKLKTVHFEDGSELESLGGNCFYADQQLEEINLQSCPNLKEIGNSCFYNSGIKHFFLSQSMDNHNNSCLWHASNIESITVSKSNKVYKDFNSNCIVDIRNNNNILVSGCANTVIPHNVKSVGGYAFDAMWSIKDYFLIPEGVEYIESRAFWYAPIKNIDLPSTLNSLGCAFEGSAIESVKFGGTVDQWNKLITDQPIWYTGDMDPSVKVQCSDGWVWAAPR